MKSLIEFLFESINRNYNFYKRVNLNNAIIEIKKNNKFFFVLKGKGSGANFEPFSERTNDRFKDLKDKVVDILISFDDNQFKVTEINNRSKKGYSNYLKKKDIDNLSDLIKSLEEEYFATEIKIPNTKQIEIYDGFATKYDIDNCKQI